MSAFKPQWEKLALDSYPVTRKSMSHRLALLINNKTFTDKRMNREGSDVDEMAMKRLLSTLGYQVHQYRDLSAEEIDQAIFSFSRDSRLRKADSVFVVLMSHGDLGVIAGKKHTLEEPDLFQIDNIYERLNNRNCPQLVNTPKIIIIQACRGHNKGAVYIPEMMPDDFFESDGSQCDTLAHIEADFISMRSCTPHTVSWRHPSLGSDFIQRCVEVMNQNFKRDHIDELFRKVMRTFRNNPKQMPTIERETLMKHFYLVPVNELCPAHTMVPVCCINDPCKC